MVAYGGLDMFDESLFTEIFEPFSSDFSSWVLSYYLWNSMFLYFLENQLLSLLLASAEI